MSPSEVLRRATVDLIALPVKPSCMKKLPNFELIKDSAGYPAVLVKEGGKNPTSFTPAIDDATRPFGLPAWPILMMKKDDSILPTGRNIVQAVRRMWHGATEAPIVTTRDWYWLTSAKKVVALTLKSDLRWPLMDLSYNRSYEGIYKNHFLGGKNRVLVI